VVAEHAALQTLGLALGLAAALLALLPVLLSPSARVSYIPLAATLGAVFLSGLYWTWAAARLALRGELLPALRNE
jgi:putative ABC transport system permease protein